MSAATPLPRRGGGTARSRSVALLAAAGLATPPTAPASRRAAGRPAPSGRAGARAEARARQRPQLRAVPPPEPRAHPLLLAATVAVGAVVLLVGVLGVVALNALAAEASFEAKGLEHEISDLTLRHDDLVAAVARLESPDRVRQVAIGQLGLLEPEVPGFLTVDAADLPVPDPKAPAPIRILGP